MCGIAGAIAPPHRVDEEALRQLGTRMGAAIAHRGPDDAGTWTDAAAGLVLAHRRLAIVDLSPEGHQPMVSDDGRWVIAFNGEIYNHHTLRGELAARGQAFRGHSDTEVLLAAIAHWGVEAALARSNGMLALAAWDRHARTLWLARDRVGKKPLYYGWTGDGTFLFGSELAALRACPSLRTDVDPDALALLLRLDYIPAPHCILKGVRKLPAGALVRIDATRTDARSVPDVHRWWNAHARHEAAIDAGFEGDEDAALDALEDVRGRVLYVDDGSRDATWNVLRTLAANDPRVSVMRLSRNFGKEAALTAGLDRVDAGAAIILDADGQDPPELIGEFVREWRAGYDNVHGTRIARDGEGWLKRATAHAFYRVIGRLSKTPIPADTGDFRLLSPRALAALRELRERHRFMKGLFGWVGFNQKALPYHRQARVAGNSSFGFWKLWNFALEGITSFTTAPLRVATYLGVVTALLAFAFALYVVAKALLFGDPVAGWPTMMTVILFLGGVQLVALGLIGEYLGRLYEESKQRPLYLVDTWHPATAGVSLPSQDRPVPHPGDRHAHGSSVAGVQDS